jgi:hypothetical protein
MKTRVTASALAIAHRDDLVVSDAIARLGDVGVVITQGGSLNRSIRWVSANTCEASNHDADPMADLRSLLMG